MNPTDIASIITLYLTNNATITFGNPQSLRSSHSFNTVLFVPCYYNNSIVINNTATDNNHNSKSKKQTQQKQETQQQTKQTKPLSQMSIQPQSKCKQVKLSIKVSELDCQLDALYDDGGFAFECGIIGIPKFASKLKHTNNNIDYNKNSDNTNLKQSLAVEHVVQIFENEKLLNSAKHNSNLALNLSNIVKFNSSRVLNHLLSYYVQFKFDTFDQIYQCSFHEIEAKSQNDKDNNNYNYFYNFDFLGNQIDKTFDSPAIRKHKLKREKLFQTHNYYSESTRNNKYYLHKNDTIDLIIDYQMKQARFINCQTNAQLGQKQLFFDQFEYIFAFASCECVCKDSKHFVFDFTADVIQ